MSAVSEERRARQRPPGAAVGLPGASARLCERSFRGLEGFGFRVEVVRGLGFRVEG